MRDELEKLGTGGSWDRACVRNALLNVMQSEKTIEGGQRVLDVMDRASKAGTLAQDVAGRTVLNTLLDKVSVDYFQVARQSIDVGSRAELAGSVGFLFAGC